MAAGLRWSVTVTGLSSTFGYPILVPDIMMNPFNCGVGCVVNTTGITYNVEHTFDYTGSSAFISSNATWFQNSGITAQATNANGNYAYAVTAIRPNVTAGSSSGTLTLTVVQSGV